MEPGPAEQIMYADVVAMTRWMADHGFTPDEIAYAVEKPHKHLDHLQAATAGLPADE